MNKYVSHTIHSLLVKKLYSIFVCGGHLGFMLITGFPQSFHSGNQAKYFLLTHVSMKLSKNHTLLMTTRFTTEGIQVTNGLIALVTGIGDVLS